VEKRHAELEALYSKINPHFLSNSLNTIRMRSLSRKETETAEALKTLSRLFDFLTTWEEEMIPVEREVEFIENYLALQRYRFGGLYEYAIKTEPNVLNLLIPRMIVQPLVENASIHGIENRKKRGKISVSFKEADERLHITVTDNGRGMAETFLKSQIEKIKKHSMSGESIGLQNVYNRLTLLYGENADFRIESELKKGTRVFLSIPRKRRQEKDEKSDSS
jgi:two-component system sensor histidine kinase YesM